ncbi:MAG: pyridoxal 5'-phosphate synthase glutaminase subunit PdxT [Archaeoglobaceae archaeon]|nr:pyridoxal 5'-phosphate synthase glutaminase subunit PdxT [Archaeoglobaceae archaeon]MCX8151801.1 pyridoxal 5'-phosphate synthase glutaminase subunit PdxT [Archaeoglobaceae archaeon]MDW8013173.1 pyridoxal 5'-phosphate synthase glutaminase subunit PdxT [Archaeoglobaceae archaeon]
MRVAIVGVQGDVEEHVFAAKAAIKKMKIDGEVQIARRKGIVSKSDAVVIPGGESTTISRLIFKSGIAQEIIEAAEQGKPVMGTCAGMIVLAKSGDEQTEKVKLLNLMDISVKRNAFGRQKESFQVKLNIKYIGEFEAVFIRAPAITKVEKDVEILATFDDKIVAAKQKNILALSFHPELTNDTRVHEFFFKMIN